MKTEMLDSYLRIGTREAHVEVERAIAPLDILGPYQQGNYSSFLLLQYYWLQTMADSLAKCYSTKLDFSVQTELSLLEKDLQAMSTFRTIELFQPIKSPSLSGLIYTIEGSKAGASMINRHLHEQGVKPEIRNYLTNCEENIRISMPAMRTYLRSIQNIDSDFDEAVITSKASFDLMVQYTKVLIY